MSQEVIVRQATEADVETVHTITHIAFAKYAYDLGVPSHVDALDESSEDVRREILSKRVLLAEIGGKAAGCVRYHMMNDEMAYLSRFAILPEHQRSGVGIMLLAHVEAGCRCLGAKAICLHTCAKMRPVIRFYYASGFYIYDVKRDRGYIRALLIRDLQDRPTYDITPILAM